MATDNAQQEVELSDRVGFSGKATDWQKLKARVLDSRATVIFAGYFEQRLATPGIGSREETPRTAMQARRSDVTQYQTGTGSPLIFKIASWAA
jgi:hypothetical protein